MTDARKHVLVVDDQQEICEIFSARLRTAGFRVEIALDGTSALAVVTRQCPDLIILDIVLPDLNGFQVCRQVRESHTSVMLPIVIISGKDGPADRYWAEQVGANAFLGKPVDFRELIAGVYTLLEGAASLGQSTQARKVARMTTAADLVKTEQAGAAPLSGTGVPSRDDG